ncbi:allantoate amidohydrolase [Acidicapsa dinghuensis]|uniref:Allantoate amidohydrolase n=1 Tax=Acidicapsa dinghuensis TaxID=2218256 RepID=A0ABW1EGG5_9BACT|nr:allantoate amidohydrolase [Acidicapsa dinghuensis]
MSDTASPIETAPPRNLRQRAADVIAECRLLAAMSEEPGRLTRRFLTPPVKEVHAHLRRRMIVLGMTVWVDAVGNLRGLWNPEGSTGKRLVLGSHIDTVPDAGAFDGVLGVVLALELVRSAAELSIPYPIEVIAFSEEEGVRFGVPFLGSRAVAGRFDPALLALQDTEGVTLEKSIRDFGLDPRDMDAAKLDENTFGFFEIHIEQGPVLEAEILQLAAVTAIAGQSRFHVTFSGQANHAGTTPMRLRHDALTAAAEWILAVESEVRRYAARHEAELVATAGKIEAKPNASNVIPGLVKVTLDVRSDRDFVRQIVVEELLAQGEAIASRRGVRFVAEQKMDQPAVSMDEELTALLAEALGGAGFPVRRMPSGAGHDAMVMATRVPSTMLFLRTPGAISHHPDESVMETDVEAALRVSEVFLKRLTFKSL